MANEEDPKEVARKEMLRPDTQRLLRDLCGYDGPKGNSRKYKRGWDLAFDTTSHTLTCAVWDSVEAECDCRDETAKD